MSWPVRIATLSKGGGVAAAMSALKIKARRGQDVNVFILGNSVWDATNEAGYAFAQWLATQHPNQTVTHRFYNDGGSAWNAPVTLQTGSGSGVIAFWSASIAGTKCTYLLGGKRATSIDAAPASVDLVMINHGLNEVGYSANPSRRAQLMMAVEAMKLKWPTAQMLIVNQNPRRDDTQMTVVNTAWLAVEALYPSAQVLNPYDAFIAAGKAAALYDDNLHPSVPATTAGTGQAIYLDQLKAAYRAASGSAQILTNTAYLSLTATNLLSNGDFSAWPGAAPTSWSTGGGATVTKDTGVVDPLYGTYSARVEGTAANGYIQQQVGAQALADCIAAGFCTLAARVRTDALGATGVGRIGIITSPSFVTQSIEVNVVPDGGWCWVIAPNLPVPSDATGLFVRLFCDTSTNTASKAYYSRVTLRPGATPRNM